MYESRYNTATLWTTEVMGCSNSFLAGPSKAKGQSMLTDFIRTSSALLFKGKLTDPRVKALNMQSKKKNNQACQDAKFT